MPGFWQGKSNLAGNARRGKTVPLGDEEPVSGDAQSAMVVKASPSAAAERFGRPGDPAGSLALDLDSPRVLAGDPQISAKKSLEAGDSDGNSLPNVDFN